MGLDLLLLTLVCVAAGFGAARGALAGALGLAQLLGAYAAAFLVGPGLGPRLAAAAGMPAALGAPCAGALAFACAYVVLGLLGRWLRGVEARRVGLARGALDRSLGFAFGALRGGLAAALLAWLALFAEALRAPARRRSCRRSATRPRPGSRALRSSGRLAASARSGTAWRAWRRAWPDAGELDAPADPASSSCGRRASSSAGGQVDPGSPRELRALARDAPARRWRSGSSASRRRGPGRVPRRMAALGSSPRPHRCVRTGLQRLMQDPEVIAGAGDRLALAKPTGVPRLRPRDRDPLRPRGGSPCPGRRR
jgi:uncharacterized membrane protein required for colicin V production